MKYNYSPNSMTPNSIINNSYNLLYCMVFTFSKSLYLICLDMIKNFYK